MRLLGVDFGGRRIGVAVGVSEAGIASARPALTASGSLKRDAEAISKLADREEAELVVVGVPERDEGDARQTRICQRFAEALRQHGLRVEMVDESMTTIEAERALRHDGLTAAQRRKVIDGEAAVLILERYFSTHG